MERHLAVRQPLRNPLRIGCKARNRVLAKGTVWITPVRGTPTLEPTAFQPATASTVINSYKTRISGGPHGQDWSVWPRWGMPDSVRRACQVCSVVVLGEAD